MVDPKLWTFSWGPTKHCWIWGIPWLNKLLQGEDDWGIAIGHFGLETAKATIFLGGGKFPQLQFAPGSFTPAAHWSRQNVTGPLPP